MWLSSVPLYRWTRSIRRSNLTQIPIPIRIQTLSTRLVVTVGLILVMWAQTQTRDKTDNEQ